MRLTKLVLVSALAMLPACARVSTPYPGVPIVEPGGLAGTQWRIVGVNGQAVPITGDYSMRFEGDRVAARFNCNHMGGQYRTSAGTLFIRDMAQTLMGCPEPAMSLESAGGRILAEPLQMRWDGPNALVLSNSRGTIALTRLR